MAQVMDVKKLAKHNEDFRRVLITGKQSQVVLMSLEPQAELGEEVHPSTDQLFFIVDGHAELRIDGTVTKLEEHELGFVAAGTRHNLVNVGKKPLKLYTVYAPPVHAAELVQKHQPKAMAKS